MSNVTYVDFRKKLEAKPTVGVEPGGKRYRIKASELLQLGLWYAAKGNDEMLILVNTRLREALGDTHIDVKEHVMKELSRVDSSVVQKYVLDNF
jgi:hypothetical protein